MEMKQLEVFNSKKCLALKMMKNGCIQLLVLVSCLVSSTAQTKKLNYELIIAGGPSWFAYKVETGENNYATSEFRFGAYLRKPIKGNFSLMSGVLVGYKARYYSSSFGGSISVVEKANYQDHPFFEIPFMGAIGFKNFEIQLGGNFRNFFPRNNSVDMLSAQNEFGLQAGLNYQIINKVGISFKYLNGLKGFTYSSSTPGNTLNQTQWNRSAYLMVSYRL